MRCLQTLALTAAACLPSCLPALPHLGAVLRPYWTVANSWGLSGGVPYKGVDNSGYFYIARGTNECEFEAMMYTGFADLSKQPRSSAGHA